MGGGFSDMEIEYGGGLGDWPESFDLSAEMQEREVVSSCGGQGRR